MLGQKPRPLCTAGCAVMRGAGSTVMPVAVGAAFLGLAGLVTWALVDALRIPARGARVRR